MAQVFIAQSLTMAKKTTEYFPPKGYRIDPDLADKLNARLVELAGNSAPPNENTGASAAILMFLAADRESQVEWLAEVTRYSLRRRDELACKAVAADLVALRYRVEAAPMLRLRLGGPAVAVQSDCRPDRGYRRRGGYRCVVG